MDCVNCIVVIVCLFICVVICKILFPHAKKNKKYKNVNGELFCDSVDEILRTFYLDIHMILFVDIVYLVRPLFFSSSCFFLTSNMYGTGMQVWEIDIGPPDDFLLFYSIETKFETF